MKAAVLYEAGRGLEVEELAMPAVGEDDVLIKVAVCGVCHTDLFPAAYFDFYLFT